jgi:general secretion pathway protein F
MRFALKAVDAGNRVLSLELEASDEASARQTAEQRGLSVLLLRQRGFQLRRKASFSTTLFSVELLALLDAGLNVVEALQTLAEKDSKGESRRILSGLLEALHRGESLSRAVAQLPEAFPALYVATIRASERSGNINEALSRYISYREEFDRVRKKVISTLLYPAILVSVGVLVFGFLMFYVVPRFARVYDEISSDLPFFSSLLFALGRWVEGHRIELFVIAAGLVSGIAYLLSKDAFRNALAEGLWRIPALGERMRVYQLARFYRTAAMLLRAGIPAVRAFEMVSELFPLALRAQLRQAISSLREGQPISASLTASRLATPVATRMMAVGERSGQMGEMMERIARFYDEETARFLDSFTRVFEPLLMAALGFGVGGIVVLMYMPIFELASSIQ